MQKEGESGRKKINQWTRYLTVIVTVLQASAYVTYLQGMTQQTGAIMAGYSGLFLVIYRSRTDRRYHVCNVDG